MPAFVQSIAGVLGLESSSCTMPVSSNLLHAVLTTTSLFALTCTSTLYTRVPQSDSGRPTPALFIDHSTAAARWLVLSQYPAATKLQYYHAPRSAQRMLRPRLVLSQPFHIGLIGVVGAILSS